MECSLFWGLSLFLSLFSVIQTQCPTSCSCFEQTIDCSSQGFTEIPTVTIPPGTFSIAKVDFSNNMITTLDIDKLTEKSKGLIVDEYDFSSNLINTVNGSFNASMGKDYETMNLSSNAITVFPIDIVPKKHLRAKLIIDISHNQLTELTYQMFANGEDYLPGFQFLARNNMIRTIHPDTFQGTEITDLKLDLRFNRLTTLPDTYSHPIGVNQINISGNPWECDCNLRWIVDKNTRFVNYTKDDPPNCQTPLSLSGRPIFKLTPNEFACLPEQDGQLQYSFSNTDTFSLQCPVTADPPNPDISWNVWLPCPDESEPLQLFFSSENITFRDIKQNPRAAIRCTATNNAGSFSLDLDVRYDGEKGIPIPDNAGVPVPHTTYIPMANTPIAPTVGVSTIAMVPDDTKQGNSTAAIVVLIILLIISLIAVAILLYLVFDMKKKLKTGPVNRGARKTEHTVNYTNVIKGQNGANGSAVKPGVINTSNGYAVPNKPKKPPLPKKPSPAPPAPPKPTHSPYQYNSGYDNDDPPIRYDYRGGVGYVGDHGDSNI